MNALSSDSALAQPLPDEDLPARPHGHSPGSVFARGYRIGLNGDRAVLRLQNRQYDDDGFPLPKTRPTLMPAQVEVADAAFRLRLELFYEAVEKVFGHTRSQLRRRSRSRDSQPSPAQIRCMRLAKTLDFTTAQVAYGFGTYPSPTVDAVLQQPEALTAEERAQDESATELYRKLCGEAVGLREEKL